MNISDVGISISSINSMSNFVVIYYYYYQIVQIPMLHDVSNTIGVSVCAACISVCSCMMYVCVICMVTRQL